MVVDLATVEQVLNKGKDMGASDIHITVGIPPMVRVNGSLIPLDYPELSPEDTQRMVYSLMNDKQRAAYEERGEIDFSFALGSTGRFRVNAYKQKGACACALRIVGMQIPKPEQLGLSEDVIELYKKKRGLILVTGPTGSGKSTTLYTALSSLNSEEVNIITVEDPVEANIDGINQVQVNNKADMTFANALRSILRQDPDIIMIGEIRDSETAEIAVRASITGHLVVSTLHTNSTANSISRLADMGVEPYLIADSLVGIIAQRLVRRLCECKKPRLATAEEKEELAVDPSEDIVLYEPCGCKMCDNTGYKGRIGIYEIMTITPKIKSMIARGKSADEIKEQAIEEGMSTLKASAAKYVLDGTTSMSEMVKVTYEVEK